jgi:hypothetical protein
MNRWRQRFAELRGDSAKPPASSSAVQFVQNVQNLRTPAPKSAFEHFEQIEQPTKPREAPVLKAPAANRRASVWSEAEAERAAIVEHDGVILREWAEGFARLDPNRPPSDVPPQRWLRFVDDVGLFLDSRFCASAAALGWGPYDLFGCDRNRPFARIDQLGLLSTPTPCSQFSQKCPRLPLGEDISISRPFETASIGSSAACIASLT